MCERVCVRARSPSLSTSLTRLKMMKKSVVKNRAPAPIQITAEQILLEAHERQDAAARAPRRRLADADELHEHRMAKRKAFEDSVRSQRHHVGTWLKYAQWEEAQHEFRRARSVFERALDVDYKTPALWLKYAEMEMRHKFINHARNVWDRAVTLLPRVAQFWYKYAFMEEMVGDVDAARRVFERWMEWQPDDQAWYAYIKLELRAHAVERARALYERYVACFPSEKAYLKFAKWEERQQLQLPRARRVYERAIEELRADEKSQQLYVAFAAFEERCREPERARAIYQFALDQLPRDAAPQLYSAFIAFEKQHGDKARIEEVVIAKRRVVYEQQVAANAFDYDAWLAYIKLEENEAVAAQAFGRAREVYERAIANVPPLAEKKFWRRYIYLWIKYALFEELLAADESPERCRQVYTTCLALVPHTKFTFAKIWILYAKFLIRQRDVQAARLALGESLGKCPKKKLFRNYIELELMMGEIDRCRKIYAQFLLFDPQNCETWHKYASLEVQVGETERARAIYELAIKQPVLDMPEMIWKAYIDFEIENGETELTRALYERLLERTKHVKVWISFAQFEATSDLETAREVFERALRYLKEQVSEDKKEERVLCLETWLAMEEKDGDAAKVKKVREMLPRKVTKQRMAYAQDGVRTAATVCVCPTMLMWLTGSFGVWRRMRRRNWAWRSTRTTSSRTTSRRSRTSSCCKPRSSGSSRSARAKSRRRRRARRLRLHRLPTTTTSDDGWRPACDFSASKERRLPIPTGPYMPSADRCMRAHLVLVRAAAWRAGTGRSLLPRPLGSPRSAYPYWLEEVLGLRLALPSLHPLALVPPDWIADSDHVAARAEACGGGSLAAVSFVILMLFRKLPASNRVKCEHAPHNSLIAAAEGYCTGDEALGASSAPRPRMRTRQAAAASRWSGRHTLGTR